MAEEQETPTTESEANEPGLLSKLAAERFPHDYKPRQRPTEAADEPNEQEAATPEGEEENPEEKAEIDAQGESEAEGEENAEEEQQAEGEEDGEPISSLSELIEHQEWDPEWAQSLKVGVKVDGEASEVPLSELVSNYQMDQAADKRLEEAKQKAKSITEQVAEQQKAAEERFATAGALIQNAEELIKGDAEKVNWADLRENDPAEYAAKKADLEERREKVERMKREAVEAYQKNVGQHQAQTEEQKQQKLAQEQEMLLEKVPEWKDEQVAAKEQPKVLQYLQSSGFSDQELSVLASDHRAVLIARNAMLYDETKSKTDAAKKKVAKVPKVMRGGSPKPQETVQKQKVKKVENKFRKSRNIDDAFELLKARRTGG